MHKRFFLSLAVALGLVYAPLSLARFSQSPAAFDTEGLSSRAAIPQTEHQLLNFAATLPRPQPVLSVGTHVFEHGGALVGQIEDVLIRNGLIQAVLYVPKSGLVQKIIAQDNAQAPFQLMVPLTAFKIHDGATVLDIPLEQLARMKRVAP